MYSVHFCVIHKHVSVFGAGYVLYIVSVFVWYSVCLHMQSPHLPWLLDECLCATPGLLRGQAESCCTSTTRGCNEPNVNSEFPEGKCDGIWEEHLLLVSRRLQRTMRVKRGSSPKRLASTSSTAWMIWRRYAVFSITKHNSSFHTTGQLINYFLLLFLLFLHSHPKLPLMGLLRSQASLIHHSSRVIYQIFEVL